MKIISFLFGFLLLVPTIAQADRVDQMVSPGFHPVTFEDPRSISEARFLYVYHQIDDQFVTAGGDAQVYALQLRYAIDDRWSIIATKDGFVDFNPQTTLPKKTGLADIELGTKYVFYSDRENGKIASLQLRYLIPTGDEDVLQGNGDGSIHPSVSSAIALSENVTLTTGTGLRIPMSNNDSSFWDLDAQVDYRVDTCYGAWYPFVGASLIHVMNGGNRLPISDEGQDFFNLGSSTSTGEDMVLGATGLKYRPVNNIDIGTSFQFPFDRQTGTRIIEQRWMFDVSYRF